MSVRIFQVATVVAASILGAATAQAGVTFTASSAASKSSSPFLLANPGTHQGSGMVTNSGPVDIGDGASVSFANNTRTGPYSGIYSGTSGSAASPFAGTNLTATDYFDSDPGNDVIIKFAQAISSFGLLWGSVDPYNSMTIEASNGGNEVAVLTITGDMIAGTIGNGFKDNGTTSAFVGLEDTAGFDELTLTSNCEPAFEFVPQEVPEPMSIALLGGGLAVLGFAKRRQTSTAAA